MLQAGAAAAILVGEKRKDGFYINNENDNKINVTFVPTIRF